MGCWELTTPSIQDHMGCWELDPVGHVQGSDLTTVLLLKLPNLFVQSCHARGLKMYKKALTFKIVHLL